MRSSACFETLSPTSPITAVTWELGRRRAIPTVRTTESGNRPTGKLRPKDPDFFETRQEWNEDSLLTRVVHPNGNIHEYVYESELNPGAPARTRSNMRIARRLPSSHAPAGDQTVIQKSFEYHPVFSNSRKVSNPSNHANLAVGFS